MKHTLPVYIIICLIGGIGLGVVLHMNYLADENTSLQALERSIQEVTHQLSLASDGGARLQLEQKQKDLSQQYTAVLAARDKKVEPFSLVADIFIRLIKMIVAPLVFTTLVVGVAKLGDINSVGRIGGKTLAWFIGASFMSLLLGMVMVNVLSQEEPSICRFPISMKAFKSNGVIFRSKISYTILFLRASWTRWPRMKFFRSSYFPYFSGWQLPPWVNRVMSLFIFSIPLPV
jgi:L-cystine uptake protein TcyP (sodium:dicarboxylate symporter family)